ncbi:HSF-type DNA-binding-domain-containing protein, partial [Tribonema minus]
MEAPDVIKWTSSGQAFGIQDMATFRTVILPKHFKHDKFSSFQRQLNLYGFRKIVRGRESGGYMHKDFQRGRLDLLKHVKRGYMPPCPPEYEKKIYGSGARGEDSEADSDPELIPPPRG